MNYDVGRDPYYGLTPEEMDENLGKRVLRRNASQECGAPVGQLNIKVQNIPNVQTVSFYCTKPKLHRDECEFVGVDLVVKRRRRD